LQMYDMHVTFPLQNGYFFIKMVLKALPDNESDNGKCVIFAHGEQQLSCVA